MVGLCFWRYFFLLFFLRAISTLLVLFRTLPHILESIFVRFLFILISLDGTYRDKKALVEYSTISRVFAIRATFPALFCSFFHLFFREIRGITRYVSPPLTYFSVNCVFPKTAWANQKRDFKFHRCSSFSERPIGRSESQQFFLLFLTHSTTPPLSLSRQFFRKNY